MFSQKHPTTKTVVYITDAYISYLTLKKNDEHFLVDDYDTLPLVEGAIKKGEILMADFLYKIFKKMVAGVHNKKIDVILPHEYFVSDNFIIPGEVPQKTTLKKRVLQYLHNLDTKYSWQKTHVCEFSNYVDARGEQVSARCLPKDIYTSYIHVLKKAGFKVTSLSSDLLAFDHILPAERTSLIMLGKESCHVAEFKHNMFMSHKKFEVSSQLFIQDIMKTLNVTETAAVGILKEYGVLRSHKDEKVYKRLIRSFSPLLDFLTKRKIKELSHIKVLFSDLPIRGFVDMVSKKAQGDVDELDVVRTTDYAFEDVLLLHRDGSYAYQSHIAQALKAWKS